MPSPSRWNYLINRVQSLGSGYDIWSQWIPQVEMNVLVLLRFTSSNRVVSHTPLFVKNLVLINVPAHDASIQTRQEYQSCGLVKAPSQSRHPQLWFVRAPDTTDNTVMRSLLCLEFYETADHNVFLFPSMGSTLLHKQSEQEGITCIKFVVCG